MMKKDDLSAIMINEGISKIGEMYHLSETLPEGEIRSLMTQTVILAKKIYNQLELKPECRKELGLFHNYFMESASTVIFKYCSLKASGKTPENHDIDQEMRNIFILLKNSFQNQLDSMFSMDIMKFNAEIEVLMKTIKAEQGI